MSSEKYTIQLTYEELHFVQEAIETRTMHFFEDEVEETEGEERIEMEKEMKILNKLHKRIQTKWNKIHGNPEKHICDYSRR